MKGRKERKRRRKYRSRRNEFCTIKKGTRMKWKRKDMEERSKKRKEETKMEEGGKGERKRNK